LYARPTIASVKVSVNREVIGYFQKKTAKLI
jgi:hypothetical protein